VVPEWAGGVVLKPTTASLTVQNPYRVDSAIIVEGGTSPSVELAVYDVHGRRVRVLLSGVTGSARHQTSWDGRSEQGDDVPTGLYYLRATLKGREISRKILLIR
jgi:flagellar hook assembly protein FlgD